MRKQVESAMPKSLVRVVSASALAIGLGACSSEAMRFTEAPFSSPFKTAQADSVRDPVTTGSIGRSPGQGPSAPVYNTPVASAPVVRSQPLPPPASAVALRSTPPAVAAVAGSANGWSAQGGTPIVMATGENLDTISGRYGVPRSALMAANGLSSADVTPGTRIVVPVYNGGGAQVAARQPAPVAAQPAPVQARAETRLVAPSPRPAVAAAAAQPARQVADARSAAEARTRAAAEAKAKAEADALAMKESRARFAAEAKAKADARAAKAVDAKAAEAKTAAARPVAEAKKVAEAKAKAAPTVVASLPAEKVTVQPKSAPEPKAEPQTTASIPKQEEASSASSADFRWPARGRVIAGYAGKGGNEGINIAVPEGTPVKAAEGGVVAYAGSELKGYGNLVLIRHPNGYVSAYAHNGELSVKRGETVKRGQVVAKSGQSGNVASPQLHFELRKGSTPVDPMPYLSSAN